MQNRRSLFVALQGVSAEFDEAEDALESNDQALQSHLEQVKAQLKSNRGICYVSLNKDSHVLEIPEVPTKPISSLINLVCSKSNS